MFMDSTDLTGGLSMVLKIFEDFTADLSSFGELGSISFWAEVWILLNLSDFLCEHKDGFLFSGVINEDLFCLWFTSVFTFYNFLSAFFPSFDSLS